MNVSLIRQLYLYAVAIISLGLIIVGTSTFVNMALRAFVFKAADENSYMMQNKPAMPYFSETAMNNLEKNAALTESEQREVRSWLEEVKKSSEYDNKYDPIVADRSRQAAESLAMILVGLPLYLYHWSVIRKDHLKA